MDENDQDMVNCTDSLEVGRTEARTLPSHSQRSIIPDPPSNSTGGDVQGSRDLRDSGPLKITFQLLQSDLLKVPK